MLRIPKLLGSYEGNPVTYAGGIGSMENLKEFAEITQGKIDFTIGLIALEYYEEKSEKNSEKPYGADLQKQLLNMSL